MSRRAPLTEYPPAGYYHPMGKGAHSWTASNGTSVSGTSERPLPPDLPRPGNRGGRAGVPSFVLSGGRRGGEHRCLRRRPGIPVGPEPADPLRRRGRGAEQGGGGGGTPSGPGREPDPAGPNPYTLRKRLPLACWKTALWLPWRWTGWRFGGWQTACVWHRVSLLQTLGSPAGAAIPWA